ncbi:MAG: hypothetical protein U0893_24235 [Chloroflexota bacterium]
MFGWMKTVGGFRRTRFRGLERTSHAGYLVATAYNLVRLLASNASSPRPPPPDRPLRTRRAAESPGPPRPTHPHGLPSPIGGSRPAPQRCSPDHPACLHPSARSNMGFFSSLLDAARSGRLPARS